MKKYALISVTDKNGLINLAAQLIESGYTLITTGGTQKYLEANNYRSVSVSEFTGFPEILDGRVKTLHPSIFAGILADRANPKHLDELNKYNIPLIDLVICNLYDFTNAVKNQVDIIENIDIGGVSLIRAAAKNSANVIILSAPEQYEEFIIKLKNNDFNCEYRRMLALAAYQKTTCYDFSISNYFRDCSIDSNIFEFGDIYSLSYGENPHQSAFLLNSAYDKYELFQLYGPEISYNNILDINAGLRLVENFEADYFCAIFKHTGPCGGALGINITEAYLKALKCDPISAYGGVVVFNNIVNAETARFIIKNFTEVVLAPEFTIDAQKIFSEKKRIRLVTYRPKNKNYKIECKSTYIGMLFQETDCITDSDILFNNVTDTPLSDKKRADIILGIKIVKSVKSNGVALINNNMVIGIGGGQPNRIDSIRIAIHNAQKFGLDIDDSVLVSDGFFPFCDSIEFIKDFKIKTIVQPGGSKRDDDVIAACNKHNITMIMTGKRHFLH